MKIQSKIDALIILVASSGGGGIHWFMAETGKAGISILTSVACFLIIYYLKRYLDKKHETKSRKIQP